MMSVKLISKYYFLNDLLIYLESRITSLILCSLIFQTLLICFEKVFLTNLIRNSTPNNHPVSVPAVYPSSNKSPKHKAPIYVHIYPTQ